MRLKSLITESSVYYGDIEKLINTRIREMELELEKVTRETKTKIRAAKKLRTEWKTTHEKRFDAWGYGKGKVGKQWTEKQFNDYANRLEKRLVDAGVFVGTQDYGPDGISS